MVPPSPHTLPFPASDASSVRFPGYSLQPAASPQQPPPLSFNHPLHPPHPPHHQQPPLHFPRPPPAPSSAPLSPEDLDAVIISAKQQTSNNNNNNNHRQPKMFSVNFSSGGNTECAGYSMLGCV